MKVRLARATLPQVNEATGRSIRKLDFLVELRVLHPSGNTPEPRDSHFDLKRFKATFRSF